MPTTFLLNNFYIVKSKAQTSDNVIEIQIELDANHSIFKGHFEQMPVVPGVCQTQIIKELLETELKQSLLLHKGNNIKFTGMIIPQTHPLVNVEVIFFKTDNIIKVDAKLYFESTTFTKFKGEFITQKQYGN